LAAHGPANTVILTNKVSRPTISTHNGLVYLKNRMKTTLAYFEVQYTKYNTRKKNSREVMHLFSIQGVWGGYLKTHGFNLHRLFT
jgi:hypothetical protein